MTTEQLMKLHSTNRLRALPVYAGRAASPSGLSRASASSRSGIPNAVPWSDPDYEEWLAERASEEVE